MTDSQFLIANPDLVLELWIFMFNSLLDFYSISNSYLILLCKVNSRSSPKLGPCALLISMNSNSIYSIA